MAILSSKQTFNTGTEPLYLTPWWERPCHSAYYVFYLEQYALCHPHCLTMSLTKKKSGCRVYSFQRKTVIYSGKWIGNLCVWCVHSRFQCWKNINSGLSMRLLIVKNTSICKDNGEKRSNCWRVWRNSSLWSLVTENSVILEWKPATLLLMKLHLLQNHLVTIDLVESVKTFMLKAAKIVSCEKRQAFANISHNTVADRISESFIRFGQPIEVRSKAIYCIFSCNWRNRHYRWCATGHIHLRSWWYFDHHRGVCGVGSQILQQQQIFLLPSSERWTGLE